MNVLSLRKSINKVIIIILIVISICLIVYSNKAIKDKQTVTEVFLQTMELGTDQFKMAMWNPVDIEGTQNDIRIDWWGNNGRYYFFIPSNWKNQDIFWIFNTEDSVFIDGVEVINGSACSIESGEHLIKLHCGDEYIVEIMYSGNIASMFIDTTARNLEYINESKEHVDSGEYILFDEKGKYSNYGEIETIACRGNASFDDTLKKSYIMKFKDYADLFGFGESKKWLLISNYYDRTLMRNMLVNELTEKMEMLYTPQMEYVDLYINGEYIGNYLLTEKVEVAENRVDIYNLEEATEQLNADEEFKSENRITENVGELINIKWNEVDVEPENYEGGYLLELEMPERYLVEISGFLTSRKQPVVIQSPKYVSYNQVEYIANMYQDFENAIFAENGVNQVTGRHYKDYIDIESFVKHYLIDEISKQLDASGTSFYMYKPLESEKLFAGPIWDYDKSFGCNYERAGVKMSEPEGMYAAVRKYEADVWYALYQQDDFRDNIQQMYWQKTRGVVEEISLNWIADTKERIEDSAIMNSVRWHSEEEVADISDKIDNFEGAVFFLSDFINRRLQFLDQEWQQAE